MYGLTQQFNAAWVTELKVIIGELGMDDSPLTWHRISEDQNVASGCKTFILDRGKSTERHLLTVALGIRHLPWQGGTVPMHCAVIQRAYQRTTPKPASVKVLRKHTWQHIRNLQQEMAEQGISLSVALIDDEALRLVLWDDCSQDRDVKGDAEIKAYIKRYLASSPQRVYIHSLTPKRAVSNL